MYSLPRAGRRGRHLLAATALLLAVPAATAEPINVSRLVTGTAERTPGSSLRTPCAGACSWATSSGVAVGGLFQVDPGPLDLSDWPPVWVADPPAAQSEEAAQAVPPPPSGPLWTGLPEGPRHLAQVLFNPYGSFPPSQRVLSTENFRIGHGAAVMSYSVRIRNSSLQPRAHWLEFVVPTASPLQVTATDPLGPTGIQPVTAPPDLQATRSAVDVIVDGLPVWSSSANRLQLRRRPASTGPLWLRSGSDLGTGTTTLFLGTLPAKSVTHVSVVLRVDARLDAPECKSDTSGSTTYKRCHAHRELLDIPSIPPWAGSPMRRPAVSVFLD